MSITDIEVIAAVNGHNPAPAACPDWCTCQDDHLEDEDGRYHFGSEGTVTLALHEPEICLPAAEDGKPVEPAEPVVYPSQATAYLQQHDQEREVSVHVDRDGFPAITLTLAEAWELSGILSGLVRDAIKAQDAAPGHLDVLGLLSTGRTPFV